jgi:hypothetical protein
VDSAGGAESTPSDILVYYYRNGLETGLLSIKRRTRFRVAPFASDILF